MQYNVRLSTLAEEQYDKILSYISNKLKNPQALINQQAVMQQTVIMMRQFPCWKRQLEVLDFVKASGLKNWDSIKLIFRNIGICLFIE